MQEDIIIESPMPKDIKNEASNDQICLHES